MKGSRAGGEHEEPFGKADLTTLLREIGSLDETELADAVAKLLDSPHVTDTLDELKRHIDDLFGRLDAGAAEPREKADISPEFESHVEALGRKMDAASGLLAELTDVLESQTERIETIEQQLGDPDYEIVAETSDVADGDRCAPVPLERDPVQTEEAVDIPDPTDVLRELLNDRLDRIEGRLSDMEVRITGLRTLALDRDRHVRELEERLLVSVELPTEEDVPRFGASPRPSPAPGGGVQPEAVFVPVPSVSEGTVAAGPGLVAGAGGPGVSVPRPAAEAVAGVEAPLDVSALREPEPAPPRPPAGADGDLGAPPEPAPSSGGERAGVPVAERLAELVEREVRSRRDFGEGAVCTPAGDHPTVMVVDDSADARTILSIYLSKTGYNVVTAASAEDCLSKLRHHVVNAIVLDARMPGADGGHVCRMLREDPMFARWRDLPVIVYTAYPEECSRAVADAWGATDYVVKGGDMLPLISALVRHTRVAVGATS